MDLADLVKPELVLAPYLAYLPPGASLDDARRFRERLHQLSRRPARVFDVPLGIVRGAKQRVVCVSTLGAPRPLHDNWVIDGQVTQGPMRLGDTFELALRGGAEQPLRWTIVAMNVAGNDAAEVPEGSTGCFVVRPHDPVVLGAGWALSGVPEP